MASVWLSTHLWEHFAFTRDTSYLKNTVNISWKDGQLEHASIIPDFDGEFRVRIKDRVLTFNGKRLVSVKI